MYYKIWSDTLIHDKFPIGRNQQHQNGCWLTNNSNLPLQRYYHNFGGMMFCILIWFMLFIEQVKPMKESLHHRPRSLGSMEPMKWSLSSISSLRTQFQSKSSIYPCLDTFDVRILWEVDADTIKSTKNYLDSAHIRHLIRLYWADRNSVQEILSAARNHNHHHHHHSPFGRRKHNKDDKNNNNSKSRSHPKKIHFVDQDEKKILSNLSNLHSSRRNFFHSTRPSTLIEMRKLHYVREYSVNMNGGIIKIGCDLFKPMEDIFYCIVYLILYKSAILYEKIPHCVPTTINSTVQQQEETESRRYSPSTQDVFADALNQIKFNYKNISSSETRETPFGSPTMHTVVAGPTGPAYKSLKQQQKLENQSMSTLSTMFLDQSTLNNLLNQAAVPPRFIQNRLDQVQTLSCTCFDSNSEIQKLLQLDSYFIDSVNNQTITINLMITACSKQKLLFDPPQSVVRDQYFLEKPITELVESSGEDNRIIVPTTTSHSDRKYSKNSSDKKNNNNRKRKKHQKISKQIALTEDTLSPLKDVSNRESELAEMDLHDPNVCILSIENPEKYLFELDSIEPSIEWLSENPSLATFSNDDTDPTIDYFHKFPFLVVRNGISSIDPQMNIENRFQQHYLQSKYLRLETMVSMNITLRFRLRPLYYRNQNYNHHHHPALDTPNPDNLRSTEQHDPQQHLFLNICHIILSWIKDVVSKIALKIFSINNGIKTTTTMERNEAVTNSKNTNNEQYELMINMPLFHIISIILSIFIVLTFLIYAIIAFCDHNNDCSHETANDQQQQQQLFSSNHHHDNNQNHCDNKNGINLIVNQERSRSEQKLKCGNVDYTIFNDNKQHQRKESLEVDYYGYEDPSSLMLIESGNKTQNSFNNATKCEKQIDIQDKSKGSLINPNRSIINKFNLTTTFDMDSGRGRECHSPPPPPPLRTTTEATVYKFHTIPIRVTNNANYDCSNAESHSELGLQVPKSTIIHNDSNSTTGVLLTTFLNGQNL